MISSFDSNEKIGEAFGEKLAEEFRKLRLFSATVDRVDETFAYCVLLKDTTPTPVPLKTLNINEALFTVTPNVGSTVVIGLIDGSGATPILISCPEVDKISFKRGKTEIKWSITPPTRDENDDPVESETDDEILITVDTSSVRIVKDLIELNGGALGDLVVIGKLTERLNKIQSEIDEIQTNIASHSHTYIDSVGQAATPTPKSTTATSYTKKVLTQVKNEDYNNEKITQ